MKYEGFLDEIKRLADIAREKEKQFNLCDHNFEIQGFSEISEATFKGYLCTLCGMRLSYEEGVDYMGVAKARKILNLHLQQLIEMKRLEKMKSIEYSTNDR